MLNHFSNVFRELESISVVWSIPTILLKAYIMLREEVAYYSVRTRIIATLRMMLLAHPGLVVGPCHATTRCLHDNAQHPFWCVFFLNLCRLADFLL
jgi:hypothetical protein